MPWNQLNLGFYPFDNTCYFIFDLVNFLGKVKFKVICKYTAVHCYVPALLTIFMIAISQTIAALQLLATETIMTQRLIVVESLLTAWWTVIGRKRLFGMPTFAFRTMQIAKARPAIGLFVFWTVWLGWSNFTIGAYNFLHIPLFPLCKRKLSVVLPLILSWITNHIVVHEYWYFLVTWTHVNRIKLRLVGQKVLDWKASVFYARQSLRKWYF